MKARTRSISGALMMLVILPLFAGLLACMPEYVPLGNPERARVDDDMTGLWFSPGENQLIGNIIFLQPWDRRTWLSVNVSVEVLDDLDQKLDDPGEFDMSTYAGFVGALEGGGFDENSFEISFISYKTWLVKLEGETFFTWELRGLPNPDADDLDPWYWLDFRIDEKDGNRIVMRLIDPDFPPLQEAAETRKAWEKVVRKHVDDKLLYAEEPAVFVRVAAEHEEMIRKLVFYAMTRDNW